MSPSRALLVALGALACAGSSAPKPPQEAEFERAVAAPARAVPPAPISETARAFLRTRMAAHAANMSELMKAVAILRYKDAAERADLIAADASLARPLTGDATELNAQIPDAFFILQDALRADARAVSAAARAEDTLALGDAYSRLSQRCIACHALFRPGTTATPK